MTTANTSQHRPPPTPPIDSRVPPGLVGVFARPPVAALLTGIPQPEIEAMIDAGRARTVKLRKGIHVRLDDVVQVAAAEGENPSESSGIGVLPTPEGWENRQRPKGETPRLAGHGVSQIDSIPYALE